MKKVAFTLSEVLITLGIIGVVAALTIPALVSNYQKAQTVSQLKKFYSVMTQANVRSSIDNGPIRDWFTDDIIDGSASGAQKFADTYIVPYLNVSKNCGLSTVGDCTEKVNYLNPSQPAFTDSFGATKSKFYLNDGIFVAFGPYSVTSKRIEVHVDVNGNKKPNILGKDVFIFDYYSTPEKFVADGLGNSRTTLMTSTSGCNTTANNAGWCCAALIMSDGWQMADDYPW